MALDSLWEALDGGELPYPLELRSHGDTMDERAALRRQLHRELGEEGLLDHGGRLEPRIEEWLGTLARPGLVRQRERPLSQPGQGRLGRPRVGDRGPGGRGDTG